MLGVCPVTPHLIENLFQNISKIHLYQMIYLGHISVDDNRLYDETDPEPFLDIRLFFTGVSGVLDLFLRLIGVGLGVLGRSGNLLSSS